MCVCVDKVRQKKEEKKLRQEIFLHYYLNTGEERRDPDRTDSKENNGNGGEGK